MLHILIPIAVVGSLVLVIVSLAAAPWLIRRLPADYFTNPHHRPLDSLQHRPVLRPVLLLAKNFFGLLLLLAGLSMLVLPGQGLLTIFAALLLLDFPGKSRLKNRVIHWPRVWGFLNRLRTRGGLPPFKS